MSLVAVAATWSNGSVIDETAPGFGRNEKLEVVRVCLLIVKREKVFDITMPRKAKTHKRDKGQERGKNVPGPFQGFTFSLGRVNFLKAF